MLCTGAGGFKPNGFPICDLTHDGTMMAYDIGAKVTGKVWNDGHMANLENPANVFGQWGRMLEGPPSVNGVEIHHDLGVDLNYNVYRQGPEHEKNSKPPFSGQKLAGGPFRPAGFESPGRPPMGGDRDKAGGPPPGNGHGKGPGRPPGMGGIPSGGASAGMSIHKAEGLVPVDVNGASNIPGLYAAGDALGSHMSGGIYTQIGSSLAGSAVQGAIAAVAAATYAKEMTSPVISKGNRVNIEEKILAPPEKRPGLQPGLVDPDPPGHHDSQFCSLYQKTIHAGCGPCLH